MLQNSFPQNCLSPTGNNKSNFYPVLYGEYVSLTVPINLRKEVSNTAAEKNFENKVKTFLKGKGFWFLKYWGGAAYTKSGIPDLYVYPFA